METTDADDNPLEEARELARHHRLFIVEVRQSVGDRWVPAWVVYRCLPDGLKTRLGRRSDPAKLLRFVRQLTAVPVHA